METRSGRNDISRYESGSIWVANQWAKASDLSSIRGRTQWDQSCKVSSPHSGRLDAMNLLVAAGVARLQWALDIFGWISLIVTVYSIIMYYLYMVITCVFIYRIIYHVKIHFVQCFLLDFWIFWDQCLSRIKKSRPAEAVPDQRSPDGVRGERPQAWLYILISKMMIWHWYDDKPENLGPNLQTKLIKAIGLPK